MAEMTTVEQAECIFSFGQKMRHHILAIQTQVRDSRCASPDGEGLSVSQLPMVLLISKHREITISKLADALRVSAPSASNMVDRLVEKGIVVRERSSDDRRVVVVSLTTKAMVRVEQVEEAILASFIDIVDEIGPETAKKWCEVVDVVEGVLDRKIE